MSVFAKNKGTACRRKKAYMRSQEEIDIELIETYHKHKLGKKEQYEFDKRKAEDSEFAQKVKDYLLIINEVTTLGANEFDNKIKSWENEIQIKNKTKIELRRLWMAAAGIIIILLPIGYWLFSDLASNISSQTLFATYFEPYEDVISQRSSANSDLSNAMKAYNSKNYTSAIEFFTKVPPENPNYIEAVFYMSASNMALDQLEVAESHLLQVMASDQGLYREAAQWYLTLIYLKRDNLKKVDSSLQVILLVDDHIFFEEAESLREDLDSF
jgi:adenosyl cobinamide kinase/adenosyl cobinamide phosphate guanylyltransferase